MPRLALAGLASVLTATALAAPGDLLKDVNTQPQDPQPSGDVTPLLDLGNVAYFRGSDVTHGQELWRSDGTSAGTVMVADFVPGPAGSMPHDLLVLPNGVVLAETLTPASACFRSDGTPAGTYALPAVPAYQPSAPTANHFALFQGKGWFIGATAATGTEVFTTDGTVAGTSVAIETAPGSLSLFPEHLTAAGSKLYYVTSSGGSIRQLWVTSGGAPQVLQADTALGYPQSLTAFTELNGVLLFDGRGASGQVGLWRSDGTPAGTYEVAPNVAIGWITVSGSHAFFGGVDPLGYEPWVTDGTAAGTQRIDLLGGPGSGTNGSRGAALNGGLVFCGNNGITGMEPWFTDGTGPGTHLLANLALGTSGSFPTDFVSAGSRVLFHINGSTETFETNGLGVLPFVDVNPNGASDSNALGLVNGTILFGATDGVIGKELWKTAGNPAPATLVLDVAKPEGSASALPQSGNPMMRAGNLAYFKANDGLTGDELWCTGGTPNSTVLARDVRPGTPSSNPLLLAPLPNGRLLFSADDGVHGVEPWISDGTTLGTKLLADVNPGSAGSGPYYAAQVGRYVVFAADDGIHGVEPWRTDGTIAGTGLLADVEPGTGASYPVPLRTFAGRLFFAATRGGLGRELFQTDGTTAGTTLFLDIEPGPADSSPADAEIIGSRMFFAATTGAVGREPWTTDGTPAGTALLADVWPGPSPSMNLVSVIFSQNETTAALQDSLIFIADDGVHGPEPWRTDGTPAGTHFVADFSIQPSYPDTVSDTVFPHLIGGRTRAFLVTLTQKIVGPFGIVDRRYSLFATDGSPGSKTLLYPSTWAEFDSISLPIWRPGSDDHVLFRGADAALGVELLLTDGSGAAPVAVTDSAVGLTSSNPSRGVRLGNQLIFGANDQITGYEPHVVPITVAFAYAVESYGAGCGGPGALGPAMGFQPAPIAGQPFALTLKSAPASQTLLLLASPTVAFTPIGKGCTLLLGGNPLLLGQLATTPAGTASIGATLPPDPLFNGLALRFQCATGTTVLTSLSDGLEVVFSG